MSLGGIFTCKRLEAELSLCSVQKVPGSILSTADTTGWGVVVCACNPSTLEWRQGIGGSGPPSAGELEANLGYVRTYPKINKQIDKIDYLCSSGMATVSGIGKANAMGAVTCMTLGNPAGPAPFFRSAGVMVRHRFS